MKKITICASLVLVATSFVQATLVDDIKGKLKQTEQDIASKTRNFGEEIKSDASKFTQETRAALRNKLETAMLAELQKLHAAMAQVPSLADQIKNKINNPNGLFKQLEQQIAQKSTAFTQAVEQLKEKVGAQNVSDLLKNIGNSIESSTALASLKTTVASIFRLTPEPLSHI